MFLVGLLAGAAGAQPQLGPLFDALRAWDPGAVRRAIEDGADVSARTPNDLTALHVAALEDMPEIAGILLEAGADVDAPGFVSGADGTTDSTPLILAAEMGSLATAKVLVGAGADVNAVNRFERTPLFWARKSGRTAVAEYLEGLGAVADPVEARANPLPGGRSAGGRDAGPGGRAGSRSLGELTGEEADTGGGFVEADAPEPGAVREDPGGTPPHAPAPGGAGADGAPAVDPGPRPPDPVPERPVYVITAETVLGGGPLAELWGAFRAAHPDWGLNDLGHRTALGGAAFVAGNRRIDALPRAWVDELAAIARARGLEVENRDAPFLAARPEEFGAVMAAEADRAAAERGALADWQRGVPPETGGPASAGAGRPGGR